MSKLRCGSKRWLRMMYNNFNEKYFDNTLPSDTIEFGWKDYKGKYVARTHWLGNNMFFMEFDVRLRPLFFQAYLGMVMLHEMNHLHKGPKVDCLESGGDFDAGMLDLAKHGALNDLW